MMYRMLPRRGALKTLAALFIAPLLARPAAASSPPTTPPAPGMALKRLQKWECTNEECEPYVYDPSVGDLNVQDLDNPIPPGVAFEDLPDDWICPICADPKRDFEPLGEWVEVWVKA
ncbi:rubredoxin [Rhodobium orientis]|uniref:rubredoxin n=1 Tax=Rhodobium orientis TaxID=34017 RepID=UPI001804EDD5|nr:rubredoxin [Rhodobium orientis]MBB4301052.1 rubredoxin [Rhodobium orientis]